MLVTSEVILALIMAVFLCFTIDSSYRSSIAELNDHAVILADRQESFLNHVLYSARSFSDSERIDKKFSSYYRNDDVVSKIQLIEALKNFRKMSSFFDYTYYIDGCDMSVWGENGRYELDYFADVFYGMDAEKLAEFILSNSTIRIVPGTIYSIPVTAIFMKGTVRSTSVFAYLIEDRNMKRYIGVEEFKDVYAEKITFRDTDFLISIGDCDDSDFDFLVDRGDFGFYFKVMPDLITEKVISVASIYVFLIILGWGVFAIVIYLLVGRWYAPINRALTTIASDNANTKGNDLDIIIDSYNEMKARTREYETDVVLFRLLFSGDSNPRQLEEYGINVEDAYYFFCLFSSEDDYMLSINRFEKLDNTQAYRIYISENNIVVLIVSKQDLLTIEQCAKELKVDFPNVTISTVTDDIKFLRFCYSNAEQDRISLRLQNSASYPYEEIRQLSMFISMDNKERALIVYNQLILIVAKTEGKLRNEILFDMAKILVRPDERVHLNSIRYNKTQLEDILSNCKNRLISDCNLLEKRIGRKRKLERNIDSIEAYVKEHCMEKDYSLKSLAYEFNMSYSNLCHYYKDNTGQTITEFTDRYKIDKAKILMLRGMKIYDVASRLGYNSPQTFSRVFRKCEGMLPKAYMLKKNDKYGYKNDEDKSNS